MTKKKHNPRPSPAKPAERNKARRSELDKLWARLAAAKSKRLRDRLRGEIALHYATMVNRIAARFKQKLPASIEFDDLRSAGFVGLLQAIPNFDGRRGVAPSTFLNHRVWGSIQDYLREQDPLSRVDRIRFRAVEALRESLGREPTNGEIAIRLKLPIERAREYRHTPVTISFEGPPNYDCNTGGGVTFDNTFAAPNNAQPDNRERVEDALKGCSQIERIILIRYYVEGCTMKAIGDELGKSESRVSQIHSALMLRLRAA